LYKHWVGTGKDQQRNKIIPVVGRKGFEKGVQIVVWRLPLGGRSWPRGGIKKTTACVLGIHRPRRGREERGGAGKGSEVRGIDRSGVSGRERIEGEKVRESRKKTKFVDRQKVRNRRGGGDKRAVTDKKIPARK